MKKEGIWEQGKPLKALLNYITYSSFSFLSSCR